MLVYGIYASLLLHAQGKLFVPFVSRVVLKRSLIMFVLQIYQSIIER